MPFGDAFKASRAIGVVKRDGGQEDGDRFGLEAFPALQMMIEPRSQSTRETELQGR